MEENREDHFWKELELHAYQRKYFGLRNSSLGTRVRDTVDNNCEFRELKGQVISFRDEVLTAKVAHFCLIRLEKCSQFGNIKGIYLQKKAEMLWIPIIIERENDY